MLSKKLLRLPLHMALAGALVAGSAFAVDTPRDLRGTEIRQNTVKWEWAPVEGAVGYIVTVNGVEQGRSRAPMFYSYNLFAGNHTMDVRAVDASGAVSGRTQVATISTNTTFSFATHSVSTLGSQPANDGASQASGVFGAPANPRGSEVSPSTVRWEWDAVSGATQYAVTVDGQDVGTTGETSWTSNNLWRGEHSMHVKAVDASGNRSEQSRTSKIIVTGQGSGSLVATSSATAGPNASLAASMVDGLRANEFAGNDVKWQWNAMPDAVQYEVTVDGQVAGNTGSLEWISRNLFTGEHSLTVKAIDSSGAKSVQSETLKFRVTGNGSGSASGAGASPPPAQNGVVQGASVQPTSSGDRNAASVQSLIDPASYNYSEVSNKAGYELVFSDEFNGTSLNPYRWHSQLRWDGEWNGERYEYRVVNGEDQFYVNVLGPDEEHQRKVVPVYNPFKFNGSSMAIQAIVNPLKDREKKRTHGKLDDIVHQQQFLSGAISTHEKFAQKYGYFEARIKIPSQEGTFPAFWLFHEKRAWEGTQRTEIDVMENLGHAPQFIYNSFHYFTNVSRYYGGDANFIKPKPSGQIYTGIDYSQDFHTYSVEWSPGKVTWFIDGVQTSQLYNGNVDFEELYVMINLAMGGNWTNFPANAGGLGRPGSERFPTARDVSEFRNPKLEIDYVRVYRRK